MKEKDANTLIAVLNSTLIALLKTFYGRFAGTEGNLKTEVVDVKLLHVPQVAAVQEDLAARIREAFHSLQRRKCGRMVEALFMDCHDLDHLALIKDRPLELSEELCQPDRRALDEAVMELIGVNDAAERAQLLEEIYRATAAHYRQIRIVEIQKQVQRAGGRSRRLSAADLAAGIWDSLGPEQRGVPIASSLAGSCPEAETVRIPEGKAKAPGRNDLFHSNDVVFVAGRSKEHATYANTEQAALAALLANLGIRGEVKLPQDAQECAAHRISIERRTESARRLFEQLAAQRTSNEKTLEQVVALLLHWHVHGRTH